MRALHLVPAIGLGVVLAVVTARSSENSLDKLIEWEPVGCYSLKVGARAASWTDFISPPKGEDSSASPLIVRVLADTTGRERLFDYRVFTPASPPAPTFRTWQMKERKILELTSPYTHGAFRWTLMRKRMDSVYGSAADVEWFADIYPLTGTRIACPDSGFIRTSSGLLYRVLVPGNGEHAVSGQLATIHERTSLINGIVIFDSYKNNTPITFLLGGNQVIAGVDEGVTGMRVGEKRRLLVPPSLSVRSSYPANTPRDSTLRIDVELVALKPAK